MKATSNAGELAAEIYRTLWEYNHISIQSALKRSLSVLAEQTL
jgi:hypothetical protein